MDGRFKCQITPSVEQINQWDREATYRAIDVLQDALGKEIFLQRIADLRGIEKDKMPPVKSWEYNTLRNTLVDLKIDIGASAMQELLGDSINHGIKAARQLFLESQGKTRPCSTVLMIPNLTTKDFTGQFKEVFYGNYLSIHPEHYAAGNDPAPKSVIPNHFTIEYTGGEKHYMKIIMLDASKAPIDIVSPDHLVAAGVTKDGIAIATFAHQYFDTPEGLEIRLHLEYPAAYTDNFVRLHQEHFAVEYYNAAKIMKPTR
jgi:hypothetical protein